MNEIERQTLNSDQLKSFVTIAESGNLTMASTLLCRTQSAISVQLRKLESELDVSLFHRTPKGMVLTDAGEKLLPAAHRVLSELDQARALFAQALTGRIRIGIPDDFDDAILEQTLAAFARKHPGVEILATSGCTSGFPDAVNAGALDVAVYSGPKDCIENPFSTERLVWAAGKSMILDRGQPVPLAILDRSCWWKDIPINALAPVSRDYVTAFKSSSFSSLKAAIRAGFAVSVLPEPCLEESMRRLTSADGFPDLPEASRTILVNEDAPEPLAGAMSAAIREACRSRARPGQITDRIAS